MMAHQALKFLLILRPYHLLVHSINVAEKCINLQGSMRSNGALQHHHWVIDNITMTHRHAVPYCELPLYVEVAVRRCKIECYMHM